MKKTKLFLMLVLLVVGVSNAWATTEYYRVVYAGDRDNGGYTLKSTELDQGTLTNNDPEEGYISAYRNGRWNAPTRLTNANVGNYIQPTEYEGYASSISVSTNNTWYGNSRLFTITITYTINVEPITWHDDIFEYSNFYVQSGSKPIILPEGEVAVRLYLSKNKEFTDVMSYNTAENKNGDNLNTNIVGNTTTTTDDDGDSQGSEATYEYLGRLDQGTASMGDHNANSYFFNRTHEANYSDVTSVTVPATVTYKGVPYNVTAIQKWGFCYNVSHQTLMDLCSGNNTYTLHNNINDHSNGYLQSVTFAEGCNLKYIGDYAFMSCYQLKDIIVPWTVEYLGQGAFECCNSLTDVELQECPDQTSEFYGTTKIHTIQDFTFWSCQQLKNVYLAEGVTRIEGKSYGSPFQYMPALEYLRLPNTLEYIGPHFLCSCTAIEKLTIPASVTYIDGACFHGCSSLREVYLLGEPADLQGLDGNSKTFDANAACCGQHVNNATFYVAYNELQHYKDHDVWDDVDENGVYDQSANPKKYGNKIEAIPENNITFQPGMWATIIFPQRITNTTGKIATTQAEIDAIFGEGTHIAEMTGAKHKDSDEATYQLTFTKRTEIVCGVPYMIKPGSDEPVTYPMFGNDDMADRDFRKDMTDDHSLDIPSSNDNAIVSMKGQYQKVDPLKKWDFVFSATKKTDNTYKYTFRKLVDGNAYANPCKCWWRIMLNGSSNTGGQNSKLGFFDEDEFSSTTAINGVVTEPRMEIEAIYDLNGRRIEVKQEELPAGLYIVNGKKVLKK